MKYYVQYVLVCICYIASYLVSIIHNLYLNESTLVEKITDLRNCVPHLYKNLFFFVEKWLI